MALVQPATQSAVQELDSGSDGVDEISEYIKSRYLSYCEAVWTLLRFEIHGKFPAVEHLFVHLPGMNFVAVHDEDDLQEVAVDPDSQKSMLTEWFTVNQSASAGHHLTYCQFPSLFTWELDHKTWSRRRIGFKIGTLRYVHPSTGENFYD